MDHNAKAQIADTLLNGSPDGVRGCLIGMGENRLAQQAHLAGADYDLAIEQHTKVKRRWPTDEEADKDWSLAIVGIALDPDAEKAADARLKGATTAVDAVMTKIRVIANRLMSEALSEGYDQEPR